MNYSEISKEKLLDILNEFQKKNDKLSKELHILNSIISNSNMDFFKLDKQGNVVYTAEGKVKVFGYSVEESYSMNMADLFPEFELERAINAFQYAVNGKGENTYEFMGKQKNGRLVPIEVYVAPSYDNGEIDGVLGIVRDISIRKRIEKARDEIENKLKNIIEHSTNIFFTHDHRGVITYISPQVEKFLGYTPEEVMGRWTALVTDNPINKEAEKITQKAIDSGIPQKPYEIELWTKDSRKVWAEVYEAPVLKNGKTIAMVGSLNDITQRKEYELKLKENERFFKQISVISTDYAYSLKLSPDGKLEHEWGFGSVTNLTGYSAEELIAIGGPIAIAHNEDIELITNTIDQQINGKTVSCDYRIETKDGVIKWLRYKGAPVFDNDKFEVVRIISIAQDITLEKEAEIRLKESEDKLKVTFDSIGDAVITTDVKGIITKMNPSAEKLTGWRESDALGKDLDTVFKIINAKTGDKAFNPVSKVIDTGEICGLANHTVLIAKDGSRKQIADSAAPIRSRNKKIIGVVLVFRDVSEEYERREELWKSQFQMARGQKIANFGSWEFDFNDYSVFGSEQARKIYGISKDEEFSIETIQTVPLPEYRKMMDKALADLMANDSSYDIEFKIKRQNDGAIRLIHSVAEYDKGNNKVFGIIHDITHQREMENALRKSEENFRMLAENARDFIILHDLQGRIIYANPTVLEFSGYSESEAMEMNVMEFVPSEDMKGLFKRFDQRIEGVVDQFLYEVNVIKRNGEKVPVEISSSPILKDGKVQSILLVIRDISERKEYEKAIEESEIKYRFLVEDINDLVWEVDQDDRFTFINKRSEEFLGLKPEDVVGRYCQTFIKETEIKRYNDFFKKHYLEKKPYRNSVFTYMKADGTESIWESSGKPIYDKNDEFAGFRGISRDITERQEAENALRISEEKNKALSQASFEALIISEDHICLECNQTALDLFGYTHNEMIGLDGRQLIPKEVHKDFGNYINSNLSEPYESLAVKKDGTKFWAEFQTRHYIYQGRRTRVVAVKDISERKQAEMAILEAKEKAEQSDALKSAFLANMSHEIRSPMNSIVGFAKLLEDEDLSKEERVEYSNIINSKSKQLINLINDIIDISKIETGAIDIQNKKFNINDLLREIKTDFSEFVNEKHISLELFTGLRDSNAVINCDPTRIKQILNNLISNAIKFTSNGYVRVGYEIVGDSIRIFVKDTGIGIEKDKQDIIFKRFMQIDSSYTRQYGGTGLGLAIVKELVNYFGGNIKLESEPNKGTSFYVEIPCEIEEGEIVENKSSIDRSKIDFNGSLFLVAEDEFTNYKLLEKILIKRNAKLLWAKNGKEAVELFEKNMSDIDIIIMDLKMPIMNGYEATKQIKTLKHDVPIVALTAYAMVDDERKALQAGCDRYISKPLSLEVLFDILQEYNK
jgi:PAS domain S-box-containing protein